MQWSIYPYVVGGVAGFFFGRWAEMMWPEGSPWAWFAAGVAVLVIGFGAPVVFRRWLAPRLPSWVSVGLSYIWGEGLPRDLIPFVEAADMAWPDIRNKIEAVVHDEFDGAPLLHMWWEMFKGKNIDVRLYASRPPTEKLGLIANAHDYELSKDFKTATNDFQKGRNTIANLKVSKRNAKNWVKNHLNDPSDDGALGR